MLRLPIFSGSTVLMVTANIDLDIRKSCLTCALFYLHQKYLTGRAKISSTFCLSSNTSNSAITVKEFLRLLRVVKSASTPPTLLLL